MPERPIGATCLVEKRRGAGVDDRACLENRYPRKRIVSSNLTPAAMSLRNVIARLRAHASPRNVAGMARFGINPKSTLGVSIHTLRALAKEIGTDHGLAQQLWRSGIHEACILASCIEDPLLATDRQLERWVKDFDS